MALATRCPHCHTTFRVAHDQLKLRAGIVRCGACKQIFNGIEHLLPPEELVPSLPALRQEQVPVAVVRGEAEEGTHPDADLPSSPAIDLADSSPSTFTINSLDFDIPIEHQSPDQNSLTPPSAFSLSSQPDKAFLPTAFTKAEYRLNEPAELSPAPEENIVAPTFQQNVEHGDSPDFSGSSIESSSTSQIYALQDEERSDFSSSEELTDAEQTFIEEPGFIKKWQKQQRIGRKQRFLMVIASAILLVGLLAQAAYIFPRNIVTWFPSLEPILAQMCTKMGCQLNLPAQITAVSLESSELQALVSGKNTFALTLLLVNRSQLTQAWPSIELTLNDGNEQAVARRIFMPNEYLASLAVPVKGIPANSEQPVKIYFELAQLKASGYRVYLFYS
jgi:predicted Zn finger-like uncharacterized protein